MTNQLVEAAFSQKEKSRVERPRVFGHWCCDLLGQKRAIRYLRRYPCDGNGWHNRTPNRSGPERTSVVRERRIRSGATRTRAPLDSLSTVRRQRPRITQRKKTLNPDLRPAGGDLPAQKASLVNARDLTKPSGERQHQAAGAAALMAVRGLPSTTCAHPSSVSLERFSPTTAPSGVIPFKNVKRSTARGKTMVVFSAMIDL